VNATTRTRTGGVFEDALAGVQAGRAGCFGADRVDQADALRANGANLVARDLSAGVAAFGKADRVTVIACCALPGTRFARKGMPTPRPKDQR